MIYEQNIKEEIEQMNSLQRLVEIYGEIASIRMKKIREFVLNNRNFLNSIHNIFSDALLSYAEKIRQQFKEQGKKPGERVTLLAHNGKTVSVLISANTGFYGEVVQKTFRKFIEDIRKDEVEVTIIGKLGLTLFLEKEPKRPYTYYGLPDYGVDQQKLSEVVKHLVQYEEIRIYYGSYLSVVNQNPTVYTITAGAEIGEDVGKPAVQYIFEPGVEKILMFFETEIFASLFDQSIRESQLAKYASRIMAMDSAAQNIRKEIGRVNIQKMRIDHRTQNRKQINSLVPVFFSTNQ